jgi:hypothetical protein
MENLGGYLVLVDLLEFSGDQKCIRSLDNLLQDIIADLTKGEHRASGELVDLKSCSWVLHERYHMDGEEQLKWTFHHTKFRVLKNGLNLLNKLQARERKNMKNETGIKVTTR